MSFGANVPGENVPWKWFLSIWSFEKMSSTLKCPLSKTLGTASDNANQIILFIVQSSFIVYFFTRNSVNIT
jgi:hypothetical protein